MSRLINIFRHDGETESSKVIVKGKDTINISLIGQNTGKVIDERNLLIVVSIERCYDWRDGTAVSRAARSDSVQFSEIPLRLSAKLLIRCHHTSPT
jgi:hypothetical protein